MALYHFHGGVLSRSQKTSTGKSRSSVAKGAYIAGQTLKDRNANERYFYDPKGKTEVLERAILVPDVEGPAWLHDREETYNQIELRENRSTRPDEAQLLRTLEGTFQNEFSNARNWEILLDYANRQFVALGMWVDACYHLPEGSLNQHWHINLSMREITPEGFGRKVREWNDSDLYNHWRAEWAETLNRAFEQAGLDTRVSHLSYEEQGIDQIPMRKMGQTNTALERKGIGTERGNENRRIREANASLSYERQLEANGTIEQVGMGEWWQQVTERPVEKFKELMRDESGAPKQPELVWGKVRDHFNDLLLDESSGTPRMPDKVMERE